MIDRQLRTAAPWRGLLSREYRGRNDKQARERAAATFNFLVAEANRNRARAVDLSLIREIHDGVCGGKSFRCGGVCIGKYGFPAPGHVPELLSEAIARAVGCGHPALAAAQLHLDVMLIHPFADGNGRTARLAASAELLRAGYRSTLVTAVEQFQRINPSDYIRSLRQLRAGCVDREKWLAGSLRAMVTHSLYAGWFFLRKYQLCRRFGQASGDAMLSKAVRLWPARKKTELEWQLLRITDEQDGRRVS
jgi:Fic family protein